MALTKYTCGHLEKSCFHDENCKNCSNCPYGAACKNIRGNMSKQLFAGTCECFGDYENSMDYVNSKQDQIRSKKAFRRNVLVLPSSLRKVNEVL